MLAVAVSLAALSFSPALPARPALSRMKKAELVAECEERKLKVGGVCSVKIKIQK